MKLTTLIKGVLKENEDKAMIAQMNAAMGDAFKTMGSELETNKGEIQQDVDQSEGEVNEALGVIAVIGIILAAPKALELFVKGIGKIVSLWTRLVKPGQAKGNEEVFAKNIIEFAHKWHHVYIKGVKFILKISGIFKKANITSPSEQEKAAEVVYYTIIAGLAVYSGVGAISAFKSAMASASGGAGSFSISALEAAMASIKTGEVKQFLAKAGLKALQVA